MFQPFTDLTQWYIIFVSVTFENSTSTFILSIRQSLNNMQAPTFFAVDILHEPQTKIGLTFH